MRTSHLGLCVTDLDRSLRFWCDGLGFERAERYDLDSEVMAGLDRALEVGERTQVTSQFIRSGSLAIELLAYRAPAVSGRPSSSRATIGFTHLAFHVDDLAAAVARLEACGGTVVEGTAQHLGIEVVFVADPDGVRVELLQVPATSKGGTA